jgi:hypothetical protein
VFGGGLVHSLHRELLDVRLVRQRFSQLALQLGNALALGLLFVPFGDYGVPRRGKVKECISLSIPGAYWATLPGFYPSTPGQRSARAAAESELACIKERSSPRLQGAGFKAQLGLRNPTSPLAQAGLSA